MKTPILAVSCIILASLIAVPSLNFHSARASSSWSFRDDFNYSSISELQAAGWTTESIAPATYYGVGNSLLTLLNDGRVGAGAGYSNIPANVSDWSVSTRVSWIGSSGNVSGSVGSLQVAVGTISHSYDWMADGYYGHFDIGMDGRNVATWGNYTHQLNVFHILQLDMIHSTLYGYFDGSLIGSFIIPNSGNTGLTSVQALASWETNNNFDWVQANNSPTAPSIFTLSASPNSLSLLSGQSGNSTITLDSPGAFSGTVSLSATVAPDGPSTKVSPASISLSAGSSTKATLTVNAQSSILGTYKVTVIGTSGNMTKETVVTLTVISVSANFSLTDSATSIAIPVGSERQTTVTLTSISGFSGNVTLVATPSSTAFSCWFTYTLTNTAILYVPSGGYAYQYPTCGAGRPAGAYTVKITGTSGSLAHSAVVSVNITDFAISGPSAIFFNAGSSYNESLNLASLSRFSGVVSLNTTSPSSLLTSCSTSATLAPGGTATLLCSLYSATAGTYNLTITGTSTCGDCYFDGTDLNLIRTTVTVNGPSVPDFYLFASPSSLTLSSGFSGNSTVMLKSFNAFSGAVSLSASAKPGLTATISPASSTLTAGGSSSAVLTVSVSPLSQVGIYSVTITGAGQTRTHSVTLTVTVENQDFNISESPTSQVIPLGSEQQTILQVDSINGFTGYVNLLAIPSSNAIACWFTTLTNTATVYLSPNSYYGYGEAYQYPTCGAYGAAGPYTVTFKATSGPITHSVVLAVKLVDFSISASPASVPTPLQGNGTLTLTSLSGLSGQIALVVSTPSQVTVSCPPSVSLASGGSPAVTCSYGSGVPGVYSVTITGSFVCIGCYYDGTDSHSVTTTVTVSQPNHPDFYVSTNPNGLAIAPGSSANSTVSLTSLGGFSGTVTLTATISSVGPTISLIPASIKLSTGGTGTSTITVSTSTSTPIGAYAINMTETSGSISHSVMVTVSVFSSSFTISESPSSQQIPLASEKQTHITVTSVNGFSGNVELVATPSSTSVACWFAYTLKNTATVSVPSGGYVNQYPTCGAYGSAGSYTVTITGTSGSLRYAIILPVTVMDYSIAAPSVSFTQGSTGNGTVGLKSLSGLAGPVNLRVASSPGLNVSCPSSVSLASDGSASVSCTYIAASAGTYNATITASFICADCYYDGTDSHSVTSTVSVTSTDPPVNSDLIFQGVHVTTSGSLTVSGGVFSGTVSVMVTNSSTGTLLFSKSYNITNVKLSNSEAGFVLNIPATPHPLSAEVALSLNTGTWSANVMITRQIGISGGGVVSILDFSTVSLAYYSRIGSPLYNPAADLTASGMVNIIDVSIVLRFYNAPIF